MKSINASEIDLSIPYEGYLWRSNSKNPRIYRNEMLTSEDLSILQNPLQIPFIIEGYLYNKVNKETSISIKYADGRYFISKVELESIPDSSLTESEFAVKADLGVKALRAVQRWESKPDLLCDGMLTDVPTWVAFRGFISHSNSKQS
jgi:CRISPR type III-associated protein (TIGR04423 family)